MAKREAILVDDDTGSSLEAVQALLKKHEELEKSVQAQVGVVEWNGCGFCR